MKPGSLLFLFIVLLFGTNVNAAKDSLFTQKIIYQTNKASEVSLVWATNYWGRPDSQYVPAGTAIHKNSATTSMVREGNVFTAAISLPKGTRLDYYFKITRDAKGVKVKGFDSNDGNTYFVRITGPNEIVTNDAKIKFYKEPFTVARWSKYLLLGSFLLLCFILYVNRHSLSPKRRGLIPAFWVACSALVMLSRATISGSGLRHPIRLLGASFQDALQLSLIGLFASLLLYFLKDHKRLKNAATAFFIFLLFLVLVVSLLNIEVVKQLGTPFNYKWLYYSDFLTEGDTNKGAAQTLTPAYIRQLFYLIATFFFAGFALHYLFNKVLTWKPASKLYYLLYLPLPFLCLLAGFENAITPARKEAPLWAFARSLYEPPLQEKMLKAAIAPATKAYFNQAAQPSFYPFVWDNNAIDNIIVFVSESTPAGLLPLYGAGYKATPNLDRWSAMGKIFNNMYAHIPSTPNSMLSMVTGVYPMIDYKSALVEKVQFNTISLPQVLRNNGWNTSMFFSSDLSYGNMQNFLEQQQFAEIYDHSNLPCKDITELDRADLNGMDDSCMVASYTSWLKSKKGKKNFSVLWTNQTHIPYFTNTEINFTGKKDNLNRYLNALHHTDQAFGNLMKTLEAHKMLERTLVIFTADHGEAFGTHDQKSHGSRIYEENVRIPCVIINPLFKGERDNSIRGMVDLAPAIAHAAGLEKPVGWQGKSLLAPVKGGRTFFVSPYTDLLIGTRSETWKYIYNLNTDQAELYNLANDPKELNNVAEKFAAIKQREHEALNGWFQHVQQQYALLAATKKKGIK